MVMEHTVTGVAIRSGEKEDKRKNVRGMGKKTRFRNSCNGQQELRSRGWPVRWNVSKKRKKKAKR